MKNQEFIVSNAMLAAYLGKKSVDCLDLMKPFVLYLLPNVGEKVDTNEISEKIKEEFGFSSIPSNVIVKILKRIVKQDDYVEKNNGDYYVKTAFDKKSFEKKRRDITTKIEELSRNLADYMNKRRVFNSVTVEEAQKSIYTFLESYNYLYDEIDSYRKIVPSKSKNNYVVASFLLEEYDRGSTLFDDFLEIIKGSLAARAIVFWAEDKTEDSKKLQDTIFYFDTRLLINCLGIGPEGESSATKELKELIESNGGIVRTFSHYYDELHGILTKYVKSPSDRANLSLDYFRNHSFSSEYVRTYRDSLASHLEEIGIITEDKPDCSIPIDQLDWPIDLLELKRIFSETVNYSSDNKGETALTNDITTIENISILRYNLNGRSTLENCKAIFVTQNTDVTYATHKYFSNAKENIKSIDLAVSDVELTAWLWLNYGNNSNELPKMKLLENAYSACCPTEEVVKEFVRIVDSLNDEGMITHQQAQVIRQGNIDLRSLVDRVNNDSESITKETVEDVVNEYLERLEKQANKKIQKDYNKLGKERQEFKEEQEKANQGFEKREKEITSKEKHLVELENQQKKKIANYKNNVELKMLEKADHDAKKDQNRFLIIGNIFVFIFLIALIIVCILGFCFSIKNMPDGNWLLLCVTPVCALLSLIGVIEIVIRLSKGGSRIVFYFSEKVYTRQYDKYVSENKKYIP